MPALKHPALTEFLIHNLRETCAGLACLVGAQQTVLYLPSELQMFSPTLVADGLAIEPFENNTGGQQAWPAYPLLRLLPAKDASPTDLVNIALVLTDPDARPVAIIALHGVAQAWDTRSRLATCEVLRGMLQRQIVALGKGPALVAGSMLSLVSKLQEFDRDAVSQMLKGFLTVLSGHRPSPAETTALRIAGLSDMPSASVAKPDVSLNDVARDLLNEVGLLQFTLPSAVGGETQPDLSETEQPQTGDPKVFARLTLLDRDYGVAESEGSAQLWFKPMNTEDDWSILTSRTADGWTEIAAEVLGKTADILQEFSRMHLIRRRDIPTDEVAEVYDLHGILWWLRNGESGYEGRLDDGEWTVCPVPATLGPKDRAIAALLYLAPDMKAVLADRARDWANRMAQSVQVTPAFAMAAE
ncbi:hypothetical protein [Seohaeicola saemankumensis]|uniref:hypothetical protein n=1 Tax=Seohaeicola saemankumensis TaxID=481181 RepID=UPI001E41256E|nr:hypothetical protein [Seohaeicola saemankumensis]